MPIRSSALAQSPAGGSGGGGSGGLARGSTLFSKNNTLIMRDYKHQFAFECPEHWEYTMEMADDTQDRHDVCIVTMGDETSAQATQSPGFWFVDVKDVSASPMRLTIKKNILDNPAAAGCIFCSHNPHHLSVPSTTDQQRYLPSGQQDSSFPESVDALLVSVCVCVCVCVCMLSSFHLFKSCLST